MPVVDMPLEELKKYNGISPRPDDFDEYWDAAIEEMHAVDPQVELIPSSFKTSFADCFDMYFTGVGGARIHAKYVRPKNCEEPHPAVLMFHGYSTNSGDWFDKLSYAGMGYSVAALDCRGQGGLSQDSGSIIGNTLHGHITRGINDDKTKMIFRSIFLDAAELARIVMDMPEVDAERVGAFGGSQGGALTLACGSLEPRVKKLAARYPFLCDYKRVWELDLTERAYDDITMYFRRFDPTHETEDEVFMRLGYIDVQYLVKRIKGEVLMASGLMDVVCPPSTQFAAYNKITAPKRMVVYPDFGHEWLPGFDDITYELMQKL